MARRSPKGLTKVNRSLVNDTCQPAHFTSIAVSEDGSWPSASACVATLRWGLRQTAFDLSTG